MHVIVYPLYQDSFFADGGTIFGGAGRLGFLAFGATLDDAMEGSGSLDVAFAGGRSTALGCAFWVSTISIPSSRKMVKRRSTLVVAGFASIFA